MPIIAPEMRADMLVTSTDGTTQLIIEARRGTGHELPEVAHAIRKRAAAYAPASFFLFVSTQQFWLWAPSAAQPIYQGNTEPLLERYLDLNKVPLHTLDEREFELVVYSWLSSVMFKPAGTLLALPGQKWLVETGLQPLIYRGYIQTEARRN